MAKAVMNKPRLERREAVVSAKEILEELDKHSSNRAPEYGVYLMRVAGQKIRLFDLSNNEVIVRAENILNYLEKGFTVDVSNKTRDGRLKLDILKEKGMAHRHDTVPVREPGTNDVREPFGESDAVDGAKKGNRSRKAKADDDEDEGEDNSDKPVTPPAGRAGVSPDPKTDQSIEESKNAEAPEKQPFGSIPEKGTAKK